MAATQQPQLTYWERNPPYAAVALAHQAKVDLQHGADPKGTNKSIPTLKFVSGCVSALRLTLLDDYLHCYNPPCDGVLLLAFLESAPVLGSRRRYHAALPTLSCRLQGGTCGHTIDPEVLDSCWDPTGR